MKYQNARLVDGWQIRTRFDWIFTAASFVAFLCLEGALLYTYFNWLNRAIK